MNFGMMPRLLSVIATLLVAQVSQAQMWGTGMYGGMQSCPYQLAVSDEVTSLKEEMQARNEELKDAKSDLSRIKSRLQSLKSQVSSKKDLFKLTGYDGDAFSIIDNHITGNKACGDYAYRPCDQPPPRDDDDDEQREPRRHKGVQSDASDVIETATGSDSRMPAADTPGRPRCDGPEKTSTEPFGPRAWKKACDGNGSLNGSICDYNISRSKSFSHDGCQRYLREWVDKAKELGDLEREKLIAEARVKELEAYVKASKIEIREAQKEHQREMRQQMTEGGCIDCMMAGNNVMAPRRTSGWEILGQVALGLGGMYMGSMQNKYIADQNAKNGFATQSTPAFMYGFPYFMGAAYGALSSGIGGGAFGCGGGMGGTGGANGPYGMMSPFGMGSMYGPQGGAFGYPANMYGSPMGGGMFLPGMGAWGMPGMGNGAMCMSWPCSMGGGMMMGGMMPMMAGGMMPGGWMMGAPMAGMAGGMMPGMMTNMMMSGGMMMPGMMMGGMGGGMMGMMSPGMMMGGMSPMMAGGMMSPGMMMGGMSPMMAGGMMGMMSPGMMMGGMSPMMAGGMMPGMMMGAMDGGMGVMQMQMQMAQYQQAMAMQMQQYQNQMARQQVLSGLTQEMYSLMYRIQQVQMGAYTGGSIGFSPGFGGPGYMGPSGPGYGMTPGYGMSPGYGMTPGWGTTPGVPGGPGYMAPTGPTGPGAITPGGPPTYR